MTDRMIQSSADLDAVDFAAGEGLVPVIAQDVSTGEVRMLAYADRSALEATLETGQLHFWSRSRGRLWRKGETSGNTLAVSSLHSDCDGDTVLALVVPAGPTCHTGERACFGEGAAPPTDVLGRLDRTLRHRATERPEGSYTVRLLDDDNLRLKKLGEESAELVAALASGDRARAVEEAADLLYHVLVALRAQGTGAGELLAELEARAG
jgi:phosphoribosyl-ATP pyrophosphohydrolase/phosphoribosyl-AMP cyclohydrolase